MTDTKKEADQQSAKAVTVKYNKLKKKYRQLQQEYSRILESWELSAKSIR